MPVTGILGVKLTNNVKFPYPIDSPSFLDLEFKRVELTTFFELWYLAKLPRQKLFPLGTAPSVFTNLLAFGIDFMFSWCTSLIVA